MQEGVETPEELPVCGGGNNIDPAGAMSHKEDHRDQKHTCPVASASGGEPRRHTGKDRGVS